MADAERIPIPVGTGTVAGIAAWLVGYGGTYLLVGGVLRAEFRALGLETLVDAAGRPTLVGWLFFNAHGVEVHSEGLEVALAPGNGNFVAAGVGNQVVLYLLVPLVLLVAGAVVVRRYRTRLPTRTDAALAGATVAVGYLLCTVVALVAFAASLDGAVVRPDPLYGVVLAGLASPIAFGAVGGLLAAGVTRGSGSNRDTGRNATGSSDDRVR
ncbi:hypothetical protein [Halopiger goleimassiliensis]|uniref:hypothetical protein n=1 Tax=Halopiger goleimassiliensis TaxID=1293048 RepID=UPI0006778DCD|nr:hypothetical protein [Halopiger goleimassiliensis]